MSIFNTCILTAQDVRQAAVFRTLIEGRQKAALYPREVEFVVVSDPPGGRAGSGGGTLWALMELLRQKRIAKENALSYLKDQSILMIHAGGESRRLPAYVPEGKIFAPVPAASSSPYPPTVLDLELTLYFKYPWQQGELIVASGDVIIDFNTDCLNNQEHPITGFAAGESFERASRHGVFVFDPQTYTVKDYLQKASPEYLASHAAIDGSDRCAVDLGIVSFKGTALHAISTLIASAVGTEPLAKLLKTGRFHCDLYLEILTSCIAHLDEARYMERVSSRSALDEAGLRLLYSAFHACQLGGELVQQPAFIHFGSLSEYPGACIDQKTRELRPFYSLSHEELQIDITPEKILFNGDTANTSIMSPRYYAENCRNVQITCKGNNFFSGLRGLSIEKPLPQGFCLDQRELCDDGETTLLVYHVSDTFKPVTSWSDVCFCGKPFLEWLKERKLTLQDVIDSTARPDLYQAKLFPLSIDARFIEGYWSVPENVELWSADFRGRSRISIRQANAQTSAVQRDDARRKARLATLAGKLCSSGFSSISRQDCLDIVQSGFNPDQLIERYQHTDDPLLKAYRGELLRYVGVRGDTKSDRVAVHFASRGSGSKLRIAVKQDQIVWARSPIRLDLAGGWTDTPPYTNRFGGAVVNVAVDLNGQSPIQVFVRRTDSFILRIHSIDLGVTEEIQDVGKLRAYNDPTASFALPRAALVLLGLADKEPEGTALGSVMSKLGGGIEITLLCAVPKGSGLGTSSILAGTILGALERFFGIESTREELFLKVLEIEQMITTGGGWQDQIGGLVGGIKYIEARAGLKPRPVIHQLDPWLFEDPGMMSHMTLFYTGVTRLAKNLLQEVVSQVNGLDRSYLFTHKRIAELALECKEVVSLRDLAGLGRIVAQSFEQNKRIHGSTTNPDIDEMVNATASYWSGMKLLGAGGGGFAFFVSPSIKAAQELNYLLQNRYENERARLVDFSLNKKGLEVTVS